MLFEVTHGVGRSSQILMTSWERGVGVFLSDLVTSYPDIKGELGGKYSKLEDRVRKCAPWRVDSLTPPTGQYDQGFLREQLESSK